MDTIIKQVSSLETIFSYKTAASVECATVLRGERFSYQLVIIPPKNYRYRIKVDAPQMGDSVIIYKVRDAVMDYPFSGIDENSDLLTRTPGLIPDILIPIKDENNCITLHEHDTHVLWVRIDVPRDFPAGKYNIKLELLPLEGHVWEPVAESPSYATLTLEVIPFNIPEQSLIYTQWFYADCIADYYDVPVYSEKHWDMIEKYLKTAVDTGINMILTPIITPPLDTAKGIYRTNVQLVDITVKDNRYLFDFAKLDRWIALCKKVGIKYFEMSQLFSQWGLKYTPGIVANVNGKEEYIFGWHVDSKSSEYAAFLRAFLPAVVNCLKKNKVYEYTFFHISDEPTEESLETYKYASELIKPLIGTAKILDALSDYEFYKKELVDIPVTDAASMQNFIDKGIKEQWVYYAEDLRGISIRNLSAPPYRNRIMGLQLYKYDIKGFLHWGYNFYNTALSYHKVNPYITSSGEKTLMSGGAFSVYPGSDGALLSSRALVFYEGLQDIAVCSLLEKIIGRDEVMRIIGEASGMDITFWDYPRNTKFLTDLRKRITEEIKSKSKAHNSSV